MQMGSGLIDCKLKTWFKTDGRLSLLGLKSCLEEGALMSATVEPWRILEIAFTGDPHLPQ